jgi:hypothetical protein
MVYEWVAGKHAYTRGSPLVGLEVGAFPVGQTNLKAVSSKVIKHEKTYSDNQHGLFFFKAKSTWFYNICF